MRGRGAASGGVCISLREIKSPLVTIGNTIS